MEKTKKVFSNKVVKEQKYHFIRKSVFIGIIGSILLISIYFLTLSIYNSFSHAIEQFLIYKYWISFLVIGFGVQVGLFAYIRTILKLKQMGMIKTEMAATGTVSSASMVACCLHHATDVLPLIGLSSAAIFLNKYQELFMSTGIISNLIGINLMLGIIQKNKMYNNTGLFSKLMKYDMKKLMKFTIIIGIILFSIALIKTKGGL